MTERKKKKDSGGQHRALRGARPEGGKKSPVALILGVLFAAIAAGAGVMSQTGEPTKPVAGPVAAAPAMPPAPAAPGAVVPAAGAEPEETNPEPEEVVPGPAPQVPDGPAAPEHAPNAPKPGPKPALPSLPQGSAAPPKGIPANAHRAKVVKCVDGDTLVVRIEGDSQDTKIRMKGVDTPETVHPTKPVERFGKEASNFTKERLAGKTIWVEPDAAGRDLYKRLLAFIWCEDGTCHNETLIKLGYGHAYTRYPFERMEKYRALEKAAREGKKGLWGP